MSSNASWTPDFLVLPYDVLQDDRLTLRQIRVLMALFSWRKKNTSLARVSREMLAERTGYPVSRISTITTELVKLGWVEKEGNGGNARWCEYLIREIPGNGYQNGNHNGYQNGNPTVTESVTHTVTESVTPIQIERDNRKKAERDGLMSRSGENAENATASELLDHLNAAAGTRYRPVRSNLSLIRARLTEGHSPDDIRRVIDVKVSEWKGTKFEKYLRPATLFGAQKFNQYVGQSHIEEKEDKAFLDWLNGTSGTTINGEVVDDR